MGLVSGDRSSLQFVTAWQNTPNAIERQRGNNKPGNPSTSSASAPAASSGRKDSPAAEPTAIAAENGEQNSAKFMVSQDSGAVNTEAGDNNGNPGERMSAEPSP